MYILSGDNRIIDTDQINKETQYWVLSFEDYSDPDFMQRTLSALEEYTCPAMSLDIGDYTCVVPLHWRILCTDYDYVQTIPLEEINRNDHLVFSFNPITGFMPDYLPLRVSVKFPAIYPNLNWSCPVINEKDLIVVPLLDNNSPRGIDPPCVIFSTNKNDIHISASEIWGDAQRPPKKVKPDGKTAN